MSDAPEEETHDHPSPGAASPDSRKRKRGLPRAAHACDSCRKRKSKCDQEQPCSSCIRHSFECAYRPKGPRSRSENSAELVSAASSIPSNAKEQKALLLAREHNAVNGASSSSPFLHIAAATDLTRSWQPVSEAPKGGQDQVHAEAVRGNGIPKSQRSHSQSAVVEQDSDSLGGLNSHTQGHEFYGPMGAFSFLSRLRSKALSEAGSNPPAAHAQRRGSRNLEDISIVNLLHSSDYPVAIENSRPVTQPTVSRKQTPKLQSGRQREDTTAAFTDIGEWYRTLPLAVDVEKECARLYFQNLHNIHPILEPTTFLARCEKEVWSPSSQGRPLASSRHGLRTFLALYNSVLAIGAITAGEQSSLVWQQTVDFLNAAESACGMRSNPSTYPPLRLARLFFEKSKALLGDIFDSCSFEGAQTLFLMSVFCQNALKPHNCYMYSGMAARASFAIGVPNKTGPGSEPAAMLWWGLYSHEIEMCASAGRESALSQPSRYAVSLPRGPTSNSSRDMIACMVDLAQLLHQLYVDLYLPQGDEHLPAKLSRSKDLDLQLMHWRESLPASINLDSASLKEPEQVTKQKIVLKLRFFNARILLYRPFLIAASNPTHRNNFGPQVDLCVDASRKTIDLLYDAYMHRPYFRTWWYNCTYALYASMILLYVVLARLHTIPAEELLYDAEKSLEIFKTMDMVAVARKCAKITQEVLDIARKSVADRAMSERKLPPLAPNLPDQIPEQSSEVNTGSFQQNGVNVHQDDIYANLLNGNLLSSFMEFDGSNAWMDDSIGPLVADNFIDAGLAGFNLANFGVLDNAG